VESRVHSSWRPRSAAVPPTLLSALSALLCVACGAVSRPSGPRTLPLATVPIEATRETTHETPPEAEPRGMEPSVAAVAANTVSSRQETPADATRAWLYRVSGGDSAAPSYVLGTLHVGVSFRRALPRPLDRALYDARTVVMEIDLHEAQRYLRSPHPSARGPSLRLDRALPRESWMRLTTELAFVARPEELAQVPAGMLAIYLRQVRMAEVEAADDGWPRLPGTASPTHLDRWVFDWAMQWCVPFVALETPQETVAALSTVERASPVEAIRSMVDDPEHARMEARRMREAYLSLDEARIDAVLSGMSEEERHATFMLRNRAWMERLVPEIREGSAFVAVGLAHLVGEGSLVELLRAEGYTVERVLGDGGLSTPEGAGSAWSRAPRRLVP